jgi:hypothetical protein
VRCDDALAAISAAVDGELVDDDGALRAELDEHIAGCEECRDFQGFTVELRAHLRFEAVDATPDVAPAVVAVLEKAAEDEAARAEADRGKGSGRGHGATVTALPFWRRARSALRPSDGAGGAGGARGARGGRGGRERGRPRPLAAAAAAALVTGVIAGAAFVGVGHDTTPTAWAEDLPQQVVEAQRDITSLDADIEVVERGRPDITDDDGERRFRGHLAYESPERLALELAEVQRAAGDAAFDLGTELGTGASSTSARSAGVWGRLEPGEGDVHLLVRDDRWWLETVRSCAALAGQTSCPPGGARWTREVTGREAFSDAAPIPLELIGPVDSFTLAAAPPVLGERRIAGRDAVGVRVPAAQVAHFLAALSPGDDLRTVHPSDPVDVWLDRDDLVPLAVDVSAAPSAERAAWATANGYLEQPGDTVLSFEVSSVDVNRGVADDAFEWPESEDPAEARGEVDQRTDVTTTTVPGDVLTEGYPGEDDAPADGDPVDGADGESGLPGIPGEEVGGGPVGGAGLPTSTTTTTVRRPADAGDRILDRDGTVGLPDEPITTTTSSTVPEAPGDPQAPGSSTTLGPTTTLGPSLTTTTTTGAVDDGGGLVDDPSGEGGVDDGSELGDESDGSAPDEGAGDGTAEDGDGDGLDEPPAIVDDHTEHDDGFRRGDADLVPEPGRLPEGMEPHVSGTIRTGDGPLIGVRSWTDGRAWVKVRATDGWDGPRLFGELGTAVRPVDLGAAGQGYVSADGRKVAIHTDDLDLLVCGSLPTEQLRDIAGSLDVVGEAVPTAWPESATATLDQARAAQPGLLTPAGLEGFGPPAVGVTGGSVWQLYAGPGDRTFTLTRSNTPVLAPPAGDDSFGVEVRGTDGRYSAGRGELEWTENGASYSLLSPTVALDELLTIADTLASVPDAP